MHTITYPNGVTLTSSYFPDCPICKVLDTHFKRTRESPERRSAEAEYEAVLAIQEHKKAHL